MNHKVKIWSAFVLSFLVILIGKVGIGTFLIDPFMLTFLGYLSTRLIYKDGGFITKAKPKEFCRQYILLLYPLSFLSLWVLGALAYWRVIPATGAYFGLVPESWIGTLDGNSFMWNGFVTPLLGAEIVPKSLIPTYNYCEIPLFNISLFTLWGIIVWLSLPLILGWAIIVGQAHAYLINHPESGQKFRKHRATAVMAGIGLFLSFLVISVTLFLVHVICV